MAFTEKFDIRPTKIATFVSTAMGFGEIPNCEITNMMQIMVIYYKHEFANRFPDTDVVKRRQWAMENAVDVFIKHYRVECKDWFEKGKPDDHPVAHNIANSAIEYVESIYTHRAEGDLSSIYYVWELDKCQLLIGSRT